MHPREAACQYADYGRDPLRGVKSVPVFVLLFILLFVGVVFGFFFVLVFIPRRAPGHYNFIIRPR